ncbi:MAG: PrsW family intramembrane metalloprotease [Lachnospiraceae bacterium]|nr:PrsW family intramembrane metalloprotease [Lachnospiraceae bacterium]
MTFLIWLAVIPGLYLILRVYKLDKQEKEPAMLIFMLILLGAVSVFPIAFLENCLDGLFVSMLNTRGIVYMLIENFIVVALLEEVGKFFIMERCSWNNPAFNYHFDGIVYAVCTGMGFAIAENIMYVVRYGFETAVIRMLTAIPAHCIFAIFMGHYYGASKAAEIAGDRAGYAYARKMSLIVPIVLHGGYDVVAALDSFIGTIIFIVAVVALDIVAVIRLHQYSREDRPVSNQ